jgi:putative lipoic acid-binding regulatory protein
MVALGTPGRLGWDVKPIVKWSSMKPLLSFPTTFPVKVMGANKEGFESLVLEIIQKHASLDEEHLVSCRHSRGGKFLSLTVYVHAESQQQLDAIYGELSSHERVLMML